MNLSVQTGVWILASVLAVALGRTLPVFFADGMPQRPGEDVLALVLGDVRQELSKTLMDKTEEYFHGGIRNVVCETGLTGEGHGQEKHDDEHEVARPVGVSDVWSRINQRVHEQVDRHLEREQSAELLPWLWAACRTSSQNVQAFQTGSFVLSSMLEKPEEGVRLLEEGIRKNPACAELDFSLGELLLNTLHDAKRAEPCFLSARQKSHPVDGPAGADGRILHVRTLFYLGYLAKQRGDLEAVRTYLAEAETVNPEHVSTRDLRKLIGK
ncbi:MAG: hypothetical protein WCK89_01570 [bacterium]